MGVVHGVWCSRHRPNSSNIATWWIFTYLGENLDFSSCMSRCVRTLLRWNVLVELNWLSLSTELVRMVMNGWGSQKLHTLTLFTCYCIVCIFFFPHLVVPPMSSYLPRLLFYFVFISLEKSAFLVPCGQFLVFSTQIGNIPLMDPSSAPFHFHYWACFVCYIIGNQTVIKKKFHTVLVSIFESKM